MPKETMRIPTSSQTPRTLQTPKTLQTLLRPFYQFIFPPVCFSCGQPLEEHERRVCTNCWKAMRPVSAGDEVYRETLSRLLERGYVAGLVSRLYFDKEGPLQSLIHQLKYNGMTSLGVALGERLAEVLEPELADHSYTLLPVPLHRTKTRERGYNQSEHICKGVSRVTGLPVSASLLKRMRYTQSQTALDIEERRENVADAFALSPRAGASVADNSFILVDDVITTGATIDACARLLVEHGAKRVLACSVALAP